jgi:hypothetical protein
VSDHTVRNDAHLDGCRRVRDLLRKELPNGNAGFVATDLDLLVRWYGPNYELDDRGAFALVEVKHRDACFTHAQSRTFELLDSMLRTSDDADRYRGLYLLHDYGDGTYRFSGQPMKHRMDSVDVGRWAAGLVDVPRLYDDRGRAA